MKKMNLISFVMLLTLGIFFVTGCTKANVEQEQVTTQVQNVSQNEDPVWHEDFSVALATAKETGKPIFLNFSGSDWCIWCKRLNEEVLTQKAFKDYAKDNLVLALADFPKMTAQAQNVKQQNEALAQKYGVRGFPTVILVSPDGELVAQTGYAQGGADSYVENLKKLLLPKS